MENTFRSAVFGGFNRQDVINYITKTASENAETIRALEEERDRLLQELSEKGEQAARAEELSAQCTDLESRLTAVQAEKATLSGEVEEKDALAQRLAALETQAEEYRELKEHIAQIELDAHRRADEIIAAAEQEAEGLRQQAKQEADEARHRLQEQLTVLAGQYRTMRGDFQSIQEHVTGELRRMHVAIEQLPLAFDRFDGDLTKLRGRIAAEEPEK